MWNLVQFELCPDYRLSKGLVFQLWVGCQIHDIRDANTSMSWDTRLNQAKSGQICYLTPKHLGGEVTWASEKPQVSRALKMATEAMYCFTIHWTRQFWASLWSSFENWNQQADFRCPPAYTNFYSSQHSQTQISGQYWRNYCCQRDRSSWILGYRTLTCTRYIANVRLNRLQLHMQQETIWTSEQFVRKICPSGCLYWTESGGPR